MLVSPLSKGLAIAHSRAMLIDDIGRGIKVGTDTLADSLVMHVEL